MMSAGFRELLWFRFTIDLVDWYAEWLCFLCSKSGGASYQVESRLPLGKVGVAGRDDYVISQLPTGQTIGCISLALRKTEIVH